MTQFTREFPERWAESEEGLVAKMDGSPKDGLFAAKTAFDTEMLLMKPTTMIKKITPLSYDACQLVGRNDSNVTPLAFDLRNARPHSNHQSILETMDGTRIVTLVLQDEPSMAIRDIGADHVWFVYQGSGVVHTELGWMYYHPGDFIYIPSSMLSYFDNKGGGKNTLVGIQSDKGLRLPAKSPYQNMGVPFRAYDMRLPRPYEKKNPGPDLHHIHVRRAGRWSQIEYEYTPFLCTAWNGTSYPFAIHRSQLNFAYTTSIHADPTNFTLFAAPDLSVAVSVLGPRFVHSLPYHHLNKYDEFLFNAENYGAREGSKDGVGQAGTASFHPQGPWHGPQSKALEAWKPPASPKDTPLAKELSIMFETRQPLQLCEGGQQLLTPDYEHSWSEK